MTGRLLLILAALLWSLSSLFTRLFQTPSIWGINEPALTPLQIAFYRSFFAGLFFLPMVKLRDIRFRPAMFGMVGAFAVMNVLFLTAMARGSAANAIFLQYTAPLWVFLLGMIGIGERAQPGSGRMMTLCGLGLLVIILGSWFSGTVDDPEVIALALGSGVAYSAVLLGLRYLRAESSAWLTALNHLGAAICLWPFVMHYAWPTVSQFVALALFGVVQMGIPYWLMARGLRTIKPQEAGMITLLEPILTPLWAYLMVPDKESPSWSTWLGGIIILGALAWRYWPRRSASPAPVSP